jgi:hypothetical protein
LSQVLLVIGLRQAVVVTAPASAPSQFGTSQLQSLLALELEEELEEELELPGHSSPFSPPHPDSL